MLSRAKSASVVPVYGRTYHAMTHLRKSPDGRKKRANRILERELLREKGDRLGQLIVNKLILRYGRRYKQIITLLVREFLSRTSRITPSDLESFEDEVAEHIRLTKEGLPQEFLQKVSGEAASEQVPEQVGRMKRNSRFCEQTSNISMYKLNPPC
jgi:hypothetical protein